MRKQTSLRCSIRGRFPSLFPDFGDGSPQPTPSRRIISGTLPQRTKALSGTIPLNFGDVSPYVWAGRDVFRGRFPSADPSRRIISGTLSQQAKALSGMVPLNIGDGSPLPDLRPTSLRGRHATHSLNDFNRAGAGGLLHDGVRANDFVGGLS